MTKDCTVTAHCGPTSETGTAARLQVAVKLLLVELTIIFMTSWLLTLSVKCLKSVKTADFTSHLMISAEAKDPTM